MRDYLVTAGWLVGGAAAAALWGAWNTRKSAGGFLKALRVVVFGGAGGGKGEEQ